MGGVLQAVLNTRGIKMMGGGGVQVRHRGRVNTRLQAATVALTTQLQRTAAARDAAVATASTAESGAARAEAAASAARRETKAAAAEAARLSAELQTAQTAAQAAGRRNAAQRKAIGELRATVGSQQQQLQAAAAATAAETTRANALQTERDALRQEVRPTRQPPSSATRSVRSFPRTHSALVAKTLRRVGMMYLVVVSFGWAVCIR
jgi:chromosome segregation ATPase